MTRIITDAPVEKLVIDLFDHRVEAPGDTIEAYFRKCGTRCQDVGRFANVIENFLADESGILEPIVEIELLQEIV